MCGIGTSSDRADAEHGRRKEGKKLHSEAKSGLLSMKELRSGKRTARIWWDVNETNQPADLNFLPCKLVTLKEGATEDNRREQPLWYSNPLLPSSGRESTLNHLYLLQVTGVFTVRNGPFETLVAVLELLHPSAKDTAIHFSFFVTRIAGIGAQVATAIYGTRLPPRALEICYHAG